MAKRCSAWEAAVDEVLPEEEDVAPMKLLEQQLDSLVSQHSLEGVLVALSTLCAARAVHTASRYGDAELCAQWAATSDIVHSALQLIKDLETRKETRQ